MSNLKKKICVVVASRANYGRIKSALLAIKQHPKLELQLVVGASALLYRFGKVVDIVRNDGFDVSAQIYSIIEGENLTTMAKSTGLGIIELATLFENLQPDVVLTVADRFETLSTTVAASYMNIRVAHTQGGEVTGSIDESVRHAITKLAHMHFVATEKSRERVIRMGEDPNSVFNTGCPAIDVLANNDLTLDKKIFEKLQLFWAIRSWYGWAFNNFFGMVGNFPTVQGKQRNRQICGSEPIWPWFAVRRPSGSDGRDMHQPSHLHLLSKG